MAAEYLAAVRMTQPVGPYSLGGWSLGGVIALEMASQLAATGEAVSLLALFDSALPEVREVAAVLEDEEELWRSFARQLGLSPGATAWGPEDLMTQAKDAGVLPASTEGAALARWFRVYKANLQAFRDYAPKPYAERVTLWQAADRPAQERRRHAERWRSQTGAAMRILEVPGTHHTLLREPNVAALAADLDQLLIASDVSMRPRSL
jgi:thioesterase domain-containing protein